MIAAPELASAKPYLLRAMYEWCADQGLTPYVTVFVDESVQVPIEFVRDNAITLNVGADATNGLLISNENLEFKARFGGVPRQISVPVTHVMAIYGRENGHGMAFPISEPAEVAPHPIAAEPQLEREPVEPAVKKESTRPTLTRIK